MKRTLAFSLFLALAVTAVAQTPTVVEKPAPKTSAAKPAAQTATKPSPATVKTGAATAQKDNAVTAQKPAAAAAKPAVVAVQPTTAKPVAVSSVKATSNSNAKVVAVPAMKGNPNSAANPAVAVKPMPQPVPGKSGHAVVATPAVKAVGPQPVKAMPVAVKGSPVKPGSKAKDPFSAGKTKAHPVIAKAPLAKAPMMTVAVKDNKPADVKKPAPKKITAAGRRDPFISPVVSMGAVGSGCSSGKRCLTIDQIALKGVVRSDNGMIAVVVNAMDKAYFLRENDPVFNGYVVKITGDSIVFKETFKDKLGKPLTRDVTKSIRRPVA
jgi:Tfp pilus assembly protein PilP